MKSRFLHMKRASRCVLFVLLLSAMELQKGYAETIGNLNYDLDRNALTATVTGHKNGQNATGSLVIPSTVTYTDYEWVNDHEVPITRTYTVKTIKDNAFADCSGFTGSLTIPNSVTIIGERAFINCSGFTGSLTIDNSVTLIKHHAFAGCTGFTGSLTIPNSVTTIDSYAFDDCSGFTGSLTIPNSVTTIEYGVFAGCSGFTGSLTIPNSVTTIKCEAFAGCSGFTGSLTIPNSVTTIGSDDFFGCSGAFAGCSGFTGSLTIPNSVIEIGEHAFYNCSGFSEVYFNATNCADINSDWSPFSGCGGMLSIGNNVLRIPMNMFKNADFTGSLVIPNSVTTIGYYAFSDCSGFTGTLTIPNSVIEIGEHAFYNCSGFTGNLVIPNSVVTIGSAAFCNCSGFTGSLTIGNSVTTIGSYAFGNCSGFTGTLTIPNSVTTIGAFAFSGCRGFTGSLTIGNSVTTIEDEAFRGCSGFTGSLTIPISITTIGEFAFTDCSGFSSLTIPSLVTSIGDQAFNGCSGLNELYYNATNLVNGGYAVFYWCNSLLSIVLGENVESLPNNELFSFSYYYDYPLQFIKSSALAPPIVGEYTFSGLNWDTPVIVPCGTLEAYQAAPYWSQFTNIRESEYGLAVKANPEYLGSAIIERDASCHNSYCIVDATPKSGCSFVNWTCDGVEVSTSHRYGFNIEDNMVLTANFEAHKRFVHTVDMFWSNPNNWEPVGVPTDTMSVDLQSDVVIDTDVTVGSLYIHDNHVLTIMPDATLTVTETLEIQQNSYWDYYIVIEDGGQLIHPNENVRANVKKTVKVYDETGDNWNLLAYPLTGWGYPSWDIQNMLSNQYDLYYYDEPTQYWRNYKQEDNNFYGLEARKGYLYSNSGEISPVGIRVGEGTSTTTQLFPFCSYYDNSISECLFRASELATAGLSTEPLGELCWYATEDTYISEQSNISIWMANVSDNVLTETSHITSDMALVYSGNLTITPGWNEFVFNEGNFVWDGSSNVLICVQRNDGEWWYNMSWRSHEADFVAVSYDYIYDEYDMSSQTYLMSTSYMRPNTIFVTVGQLEASEYHPVTLLFSGQLQSGIATVSLPLSYTEGIEHPGYNLVGNPFVHNVTSYASTNVAEGCYRMNEAQDEIIVSEISEVHPLKPAEGFFVKATGENASITFNPQANSKENHSSSIYFEITENDQLIDRLIMKKEGVPLEKLSLNKGHTKLFVTEGQRELAIVPFKDNEQRINFKAAHNGTYTLRVNNEGIEVNYLHLIDNLIGEYIDLLANPTYSFNASTDDPVARFTVVFGMKH